MYLAGVLRACGAKVQSVGRCLRACSLIGIFSCQVGSICEGTHNTSLACSRVVCSRVWSAQEWSDLWRGSMEQMGYEGRVRTSLRYFDLEQLGLNAQW